MHQLPLDQLIAALRSALHHLYDPVYLRSSPLVSMLGLAEQPDRAAALQAELLAAIRALKPSDAVDPQSRAWRVYDLLHFQYVRQFGREATATQLGVSMRQLRREQRSALEALAQRLRLPLDRVDRWATLMSVDGADQSSHADELLTSTDQALSQELIWLTKGGGESTLPLRDALRTVLQLAQPLADQWQVDLQIHVAGDLGDLPVAPLLVRNVLLTVLSVAIPRTGHSPIILAAKRAQRDVALSVSSYAQDKPPPLTESELGRLHAAEKLATFYHAHLAVPQAAKTNVVATLTLLQPTQVQVLVVDDNPDWIELQQRYVTGTRYQVVGTRDSLHAARIAAQMQPALILLDVMIQHADGWQILSELRHDPATAAIPVVICTVLPFADLALSLGADAFLQKPVNQARLLEALDRWSV